MIIIGSSKYYPYNRCIQIITIRIRSNVNVQWWIIIRSYCITATYDIIDS
jgi:hypothetical protein